MKESNTFIVDERMEYNSNMAKIKSFTTYAERRIVEAVQGEQRATLNIGIGWRGLNEDVERFKDNLEFTKLKNNQEGIDPDNVYSQVPYEKGFQFLWRIERQVGRTAFDEFLKKHPFTSLKPTSVA
ncbi:hypothetical protein JHK87_029490 [Glycine soja]|nr:hypothetical protein JHK87_029490 [Glycine soja]